MPDFDFTLRDLTEHPFLSAPLEVFYPNIKTGRATRLRNGLTHSDENILHVVQLAVLREHVFLRIQNLGRACLNDAEDFILAPCGLHFGMTIKGMPER